MDKDTTKKKKVTLRRALLTYFPSELQWIITSKEGVLKADLEKEKIIKERIKNLKNDPLKEKRWPQVKYYAYQLEETESGKLHYQMYLEFKNPVQFKTLQNKFEGAHIESRKGTREEAFHYCTKESSRISGPWISGPMMKEGKELKDELETWAAEYLDAGGTVHDIARKYPRFYLSHQKWLNEISTKQSKLERIESFTPYVWQQHIINLIEKKPIDKRKIYWVVDVEGGAGKTHLGKWLVQEYNGLYIRGNTKVNDIKFIYNNEELVIFDYARDFKNSNESKQIDFDYNLMEEFKDGIIISGKYQSRVKGIKSCNVVVFSNEMPEKNRLSKDRWNIRVVNPPYEIRTKDNIMINGMVYNGDNIKIQTIKAKESKPLPEVPNIKVEIAGSSQPAETK